MPLSHPVIGPVIVPVITTISGGDTPKPIPANTITLSDGVTNIVLSDGLTFLVNK